LYKIFAGKYNETTEWMTGNCMEKRHDIGNDRFALQQSHVHYDMRQLFFAYRIIPIWNSLPEYAVASTTTDTFINLYIDKF